MNSDELNPYAPPSNGSQSRVASADLGQPLGEIEVVDVLANRQPWKLRLFSDGLRFEAQDGQQTIDILRAELPEKTVTHDALFLRRCLQVNVDKRKAFQFSANDFARLSSWMGPPSRKDLTLALKRRNGWIFPISLLFILTAMPIAGNPAQNVNALPFDPVQFGLGVTLGVVGIGSKLMPHRMFFLLDALWFLVLAAKTSFDIYQGMSAWWLILVLIQLSLVVSGIKQFRHFAALRTSPATFSGFPER